MPVFIQLDKPRTLSLTLNGIEQLEETLNVDSMQELSDVLAKGKIGTTKKVVEVLLRDNFEDLDYDKMGELLNDYINRNSFEELIEKMTEALLESKLFGGGKDNGKKKVKKKLTK